jgi:hypothetical protein
VRWRAHIESYLLQVAIFEQLYATNHSVTKMTGIGDA